MTMIYIDSVISGTGSTQTSYGAQKYAKYICIIQNEVHPSFSNVTDKEISLPRTEKLEISSHQTS
jgi:hypothetical protein